MNTTRIYISSDKSKATIVKVSGRGAWGKVTTEEYSYRLKGERWVTPIEDVINHYPNAEIIEE